MNLQEAVRLVEEQGGIRKAKKKLSKFKLSVDTRKRAEEKFDEGASYVVITRGGTTYTPEGWKAQQQRGREMAAAFPKRAVTTPQS